MKKFDIELAVGLFIIAGIACLGYLSIQLAGVEVFGGEKYQIHALFTDTGGLKPGSSIMIAGVDVGRVKSITLEDYQARVSLQIARGIEIQEDAIASIKTKGLIGEKYVEISLILI